MKRFLILFLLFWNVFGSLDAQDKSKLSPALRTLIETPTRANLSARSSFYGLTKVNAHSYLVSLFVSKRKTCGLQDEVVAHQGYLGTDLGDLCTVYLPEDEILPFTGTPGVRYLDLAPRGFPRLDVSVAEIRADLIHNGVSPLVRSYHGEGIVIGVIDSGIDIAHPDFQDGDGNSRILYLWDQTVQGSGPNGYNYGKEYSRVEIDAGTCPEIDGPEHSGHGTHVAGIAAGNDHSNGQYTGVAPQADIIVVKTDFDFAHIIDGIQYVYSKAGSKPAVVNLSISTHQGPHDDTSSPARMINQMVGAGRIVVAAASNEGDETIHLQYQAESGILNGTKFSTPKNDHEVIELDIWYDKPGSIAFAIGGFDTSQSWIGQTAWVQPGQRIAAVAFKDTQKTYGLVTIDARETSNPFNHNRHVYIEISNKNRTYDFSANSIIWALLTQGSGVFDAWIYDNHSHFSDFSGQTNGIQFVSGDNTSTIGIPGTASRVLTVGAYTTKTTWTALDGKEYFVSGTVGEWAFFSSIGPTRDGRIKPDVAAPGFVIASALSKDAEILSHYAARVLPDEHHWVIQGTSMAAPHVTGAAALLLQENPDLTPEEMLTLFQNSAQTDAFTGPTPNNFWGMGKLDVFSAMSSLVSTPVHPLTNNLPEEYLLGPGYPNPFQVDGQNRVRIQYSFPARHHPLARLKIYDILGREVFQSDLKEALSSRSGEFVWNGKSRSGELVAPGVYFYRLITEDVDLTRKLVVIH